MRRDEEEEGKGRGNWKENAIDRKFLEMIERRRSGEWDTGEEEYRERGGEIRERFLKMG